MPDESREIIIKQPDDEVLRHEHQGGMALYGNKNKDALQHEFAGQIVHHTAPNHPLVHVVGWSNDEEVQMELKGTVTLTNDRDAPLNMRLVHEFPEPHHQTHDVTLAPVDHSLKVQTALAEPIHHALQLRTPIQLRFCNIFVITSDYNVQVNINGSPMINIRLRGTTQVEPKPCEEDCE